VAAISEETAALVAAQLARAWATLEAEHSPKSYDWHEQVLEIYAYFKTNVSRLPRTTVDRT
jgi:hypothetical protein